jgi:hypothetical protein
LVAIIVRVETDALKRSTFAGPRVNAGPEGEAVAERVTAPLNPFRAMRVIVEVPDDPLGIARELGNALMLKSGGGVLTMTWSMPDRVSPLLKAVTVMV